jgi:phage baseplate assembly protein gpV
MPVHSLRRLVHRLFRPTRPIRLSPPGRSAGGGKLRLEVLEDRTVPSTVNWVGGSGDWGNANNWLDVTTQTHHTPTASDDAVINVDGVTVTHSTGADKVHSLTSQDAFVMSGGSLDLNAASALENTFTFTGGTLSGRGTLTVDGAFTWSGGTMTGSGHTVVTNTLALSNPGGFTNPSTTLDGRALDNQGTTTWTDRGNISVINGGSFNNQSGATFSVSTDTVAAPIFGTGGAFNNAGTFVKQDTSGTASFGIAFNNSGTVDVQMGTLNLNNGGNSTGAFVAEDGTTLAFNQGTHTLRAASGVSGGGTVQFGTTAFGGGGNVTVLGSYSVDTTNLISSTVNFAHDSTVDNLNLSGGALTGLNKVTVTGTLNWTGGTMSGAGSTVSTGALNISGTTGKILDTRTLTNAGTATWTGSDIQLSNRAVFNNQAGASFDAQTAATFGSGFNASGTFNNAGSFTKSQSSDPTVIGITFNNSGTAEVQNGTLRLNTGSSSGSFTVDAGTTLTFNGNHTLTAASSVGGTGKVQFTAGTTTVLGSFAPGDTVTVSGGTVNFASDVDLAALTFTSGTITGTGVVTVEGTVNWTGGTMSGAGNTVSNGTLNVSNANFFGGPTLDGRTLVNNGTAVFTGTGNFGITNGAVFDNEGTFLAQANAQLVGSGEFDNAGDFDKNSSSGMTTLALVFNNGGSVEVETGTLDVASTGTSTGSMSVSAGAVLLFNGGTYDLTSSSSVAGDGTVQFGTSDFFGTGNPVVSGTYSVANTDLVNGTFNFAADETISTLKFEGGTLTGTGNLTVSDTFNWTGGAMTGVGSTISTGALNISGSGGKNLNGRNLTNQGTVTWTGSGTLTVRNGAVLDNQAGATFLIHNDTTLAGADFFDTAGAITNEGTLRKETTSGTTTVAVPFQNTGTVDVHSGTLSFTSGAYYQTDGTTQLSGGTLTASGGVDIEGGALSGAGTVNGNVTNAGKVSPGGDGAAGVLTINGTYTQTDSGVLLIELGGTTAGTGYDQLKVSGAASLAGTLTVSLLDSFTPASGDSFQVLTFASRTGDFATKNFPDLGSLSLVAAYNTGNLTLTVRGSATLNPVASGSVDQVSNTVNSIPYISNNSNNHYSAILEYDLSSYAGGTISSAKIAGSIAINNAGGTNPRTVAIEVFAGHSGGVAVADATASATSAGTVMFSPPSGATFSFDITALVQSLLNSGATFIGIRFDGVSSNQFPSVLDTQNLPTMTING